MELHDEQHFLLEAGTEAAYPKGARSRSDPSRRTTYSQGASCAGIDDFFTDQFIAACDDLDRADRNQHM
jgi:hypothetical protein